MSAPAIAPEYAAAAAQVAALQARDDERINPKCHTRFMTHGRRTPWALVFWHGYTNCPQQWARFATTFFQRGHNVLIPRLPRHGRADRLCTDLASARAGEMLAFHDRVLDTARGLGERILTIGLSFGGALALHAAQTRAGVDVAVAIAPQIVPRFVHPALVPVLIGFARRLPDSFVWWDQRTKADIPGPQHAYPRFPLHGMADMFSIAQTVLREARKPGALPQARCTLIVTVASDLALNNRPAYEIAARWRANGARCVSLFEFAASLGILHDLIDEEQVGQKTAIVYPVLERLLNEQMTQAEAA